MRAEDKHSAESAAISPIDDDGDAAFQDLCTLGTRNKPLSKPNPPAHIFACLRFDPVVSDDAARLATGLLGSALAGRVSHPQGDSPCFWT